VQSSVRYVVSAPMMAICNSALHVLDRFEDPLFLLDGAGQVAFASAAAERVVNANVLVSLRGRRLVFGSPAANAWLSQQLDSLANEAAAAAETAVMRVRAGRAWTVVLTVLSRDRERRVESIAIHCIGRLYPRKLPATLFRSAFGLSARESQVLGLLAGGRTLRQAAQALSLSRETIRSNVKQIFRKCHVASQGELAALMQKLAILGSRPLRRP
jgi:DNA-binding CsgD family transcriptional regulator